MNAFMFLGLLNFVIPLLLIIGIVAAVVFLVRRRGNQEDDPGIGTLKRIYYYGLSFIALGVVTSGVILIIDFLLDSIFGARTLTGSQTQLALALALTLVGAPIWFLHWRLALKSAQQSRVEAQALTRQVYLYLVLGITAALFTFGTVSLLRWLLGADSFDGVHIAFPLVWGAVWFYHWRLQDLAGPRTEEGATLRRLYVYFASLYSLVMLVTGAGVILWRFLREAYDTLFTTEQLLPVTVGFWDSVWTDTTRTGLAIALMGMGVWWWHWHRAARGDTDSVLRQVYLHLLAVLGGAVTVVVSLSMLLFAVLQWFIGEPGSATAAAHFSSFPGIIAALLPGAAVWGYHWAVVRQESSLEGSRWQSARRVYRYLAAALGLATLSVGLVVLLVVALGLVVPLPDTQLLDAQWWRNPLVLGITLLAVGGPIWGYHWFGVQREAAGSLQGRGALSRRVYIYGVFGIATLLVLGNLSALLFMFFRDLLEAQLSLQLLDDAKWSIGTLLMAAAISVYHWLVLQEDRRALPEAPESPAGVAPVRKELIALAPEPARNLVGRLESRLGVPIRVWRRLDGGDAPGLTDDQLGAVRQQVAESEGDRVLLVIDSTGVRAIPYREA